MRPKWCVWKLNYEQTSLFIVNTSYKDSVLPLCYVYMLVIGHWICILFRGVVGFFHAKRARVFSNSVKSVEDHFALVITYQKFSKSVCNSCTPPKKINESSLTTNIYWGQRMVILINMGKYQIPKSWQKHGGVLDQNDPTLGIRYANNSPIWPIWQYKATIKIYSGQSMMILITKQRG